MRRGFVLYGIFLMLTVNVAIIAEDYNRELNIELIFNEEKENALMPDAECPGDHTIGGCDMITGAWWQPLSYTPSITDTDGDGTPNHLDIAPLDPSQPPISGAVVPLRCNDVSSSIQCLEDKVGVTFETDSHFNMPSDSIIAASTTWGDVDLDGDLDMGLGALGGNTVHENIAGVIQESTIWQNSGDSGGYVQFIDADRDGDLDIFSAVSGGGAHIYENSGGELTKTVLWNISLTGVTELPVMYGWDDFNGDGWSDLTVITHPGSVYVYKSVPTTTQNPSGLSLTPFWQGLNLIQGTESTMSWGDLEGDGIRELFIGTSDGLSKIVRRSTSNNNQLVVDSNWVPTAPLSVLNSGWSDFADLIDADSDGDLDLARSLYNNGHYMFSNNQPLSEIGEYIGEFSGGNGCVKYNNYVFIGNMDNDGFEDDLACWSGGEYEVLLDYGKRNQTCADCGFDYNLIWSDTGNGGNYNTSWGLGDFDSDGMDDFVIASNSPTIIRIIKNEGTSTPFDSLIEIFNYEIDSNLRYAEAVDFNNDGNIDLAFGNYTTTLIFENLGGYFDSNPTFSLDIDPEAIFWVDLNSDGIKDIISMESTAEIYLSTTFLSGPQQYTTTYNLTGWYLEDDDGNQGGAGDADPFGGNGLFGNQIGLPFSMINRGDFDGDGDNEFVVCSESGDDTQLRLVDLTHATQTAPGGWDVDYIEVELLGLLPQFCNTQNTKLLVTDVTGNGNDDVIYSNAPNRELSILAEEGSFENFSLGPILWNPIMQLRLEVTSSAFIDADQDGNAELLVSTDSAWEDPFGKETTLYLFELTSNDGNNGLLSTEPTLFASIDRVAELYVADVDADADMDLLVLVGDSSDDTSRLYANDEGIIERVIWSDDGTSSDSYLSAISTDYDSDGDLDFAMVGSAVTFLKQTRSKSMFTLHEYYETEGGGGGVDNDGTTSGDGDSGISDANYIDFGDIDGDGKLEMAYGNGIYTMPENTMTSEMDAQDLTLLREDLFDTTEAEERKHDWEPRKSGGVNVIDAILCDTDGDGDDDYVALNSVIAGLQYLDVHYNLDEGSNSKFSPVPDTSRELISTSPYLGLQVPDPSIGFTNLLCAGLYSDSTSEYVVYYAENGEMESGIFAYDAESNSSTYVCNPQDNDEFSCYTAYIKDLEFYDVNSDGALDLLMISDYGAEIVMNTGDATSFTQIHKNFDVDRWDWNQNLLDSGYAKFGYLGWCNPSPQDSIGIGYTGIDCENDGFPSLIANIFGSTNPLYSEIIAADFNNDTCTDIGLLHNTGNDNSEQDLRLFYANLDSILSYDPLTNSYVESLSCGNIISQHSVGDILYTGSPFHSLSGIPTPGGAWTACPSVYASGGGGYGFEASVTGCTFHEPVGLPDFYTIDGMKIINPGYGYFSAPNINFYGGGSCIYTCTVEVRLGAYGNASIDGMGISNLKSLEIADYNQDNFPDFVRQKECWGTDCGGIDVLNGEEYPDLGLAIAEDKSDGFEAIGCGFFSVHGNPSDVDCLQVSLTTGLTVNVGQQYTATEFYDIDNDGDLDLLTSSTDYTAGQTSVYLNEIGILSSVPDNSFFDENTRFVDLTTYSTSQGFSLLLGITGTSTSYPDKIYYQLDGSDNSNDGLNQDEFQLIWSTTVPALGEYDQVERLLWSDVDGDYVLDAILEIRWSTPLLYLRGGNEVVPAQTLDFLTDAHAYYYIDADRDGDLDLLVIDNGDGDSTGFITLHKFTTRTTQDGGITGSYEDTPHWTSPLMNPYSLDLADYNGDGYTDIAVATLPDEGGSDFQWVADTGYDYVFNNLGGSFGSVPDWTSPTSMVTLEVKWGDLDGDGALSLARGGWKTWIQVGEGMPTSFNDDARVEIYDTIVVQNSMPQNSAEIELSPTVNWSSDTSTFANSIHYMDIELDGDMDLLVATGLFGFGGGVFAYINNDGVLETTSTELIQVSSAFDVIPVDIDSNGGIDLLIRTMSGWAIAFSELDDDLDGVPDYEDAYHGDPTQGYNTDGDEYGDNEHGLLPDSCPIVTGESWRDRLGCSDMDSDGQSDLYDDFMTKDTQWSDFDGDGRGDNYGILEQDAGDLLTQAENEALNQSRESWWPGEWIPGAYMPDDSPLDTDNDGYEDTTSWGLILNYYTVQVDNRRTEIIALIEANSQNRIADECPILYGTSSVDKLGCLDTDGDGRSDLGDSHPTNPHQWLDSDGDGYGDRTAALEGDAYPYDSSQWEDYDGDGRGDNATGTNGDAYPLDPTQWSDEDGDGFGDNGLGNAPDHCPLVAGTSTRDVLGCSDQDGDGWSVLSDWDDDDSTVWSDSDGDGFTDQLGHTLSDDCPGQAGNSVEMMRGCADMDGDGLPDIYDDDTDGDGISNSIERQAGHDPYDGDSTPADFDGDGVPDSLDDDDDDDGFPDDMENERGSDSKDANNTPLSMYGEQDSGVYYVPGQGFSAGYQEEGYEISISWFLNLLGSEFLVPLILLPLSALLLMRKRRRFKKFRKKMNRLDDLDEMEDMEGRIDKMIERGSVKVEHGLLLRNQFERVRDKLTGKSQLDRIRTSPSNHPAYPSERSVGKPSAPPQRSPGGPPSSVSRGRGGGGSGPPRGGAARPSSGRRTPSSRPGAGPPGSYGEDDY